MEPSSELAKETQENLMLKLIAAATQCTERYVSPVKLRHMYREYCQWRQLFDTHATWQTIGDFQRTTEFQRYLIHYLLERFFWIRYGDSDAVVDLLNNLFETDGHLGKIFDFQRLSLTPRKRKSMQHFRTTWDDGSLSEEAQPVDYFLEHTNKKKVLFGSRRLGEQYFVQCINYHREINDLLILPPCSRTFRFPEILIKLLQYGLFAKSEGDDENIGKILTGIIGVVLNSYQNLSNPSRYALSMIQVGNALLRAIPYVRLSNLLKEQKLRDKENVTRGIVEQLSVPRYLPYLMMRCTGPQELQHLCRRVIRRTLYDYWKLPNGIIMLPLPALLKEYVGLRCD